MKVTRPFLLTKRLRLRPFDPDDASCVAELVGDRRVAEMTQHIPHPYSIEDAQVWIESHESRLEKKLEVVFAIERKKDKALLGAIGLVIDPSQNTAELGYWIGVPYWSQGYCSEAAQAVLTYGFDELELHRIQARHFSTNPASGRVMEKIGMQYEGCMRKSVQKWEVYLDVCVHAILAANR